MTALRWLPLATGSFLEVQLPGLAGWSVVVQDSLDFA